jgi:glycolate oxidase iron-sulfur subunit
MSSPRGRIWMMRAIEEGQAVFSQAIVKHLDQCVGCLACQQACPSQVPYAELLEGTRAAILERFPRPAPDRWTRRLLLGVFPRPGRLRPLLAALYWWQRLGLAAALRRTGLLQRLAPALGALEPLLPHVPPPSERRPLPRTSRATGRPRGRVGLLAGCAQRYLMPELNRATVRVLTRAGYEVVAPEEQGCCGALHAHAGELAGARQAARDLIQVFEAAGVDGVVANAAGCGASLKGYGRLLRDDPAWRARAEAFAARARDISELLAEVRWNGALRPLDLTVTYHEACHLVHGQAIRREPRSVLQAIPGLRLVELPESDVCCGSGGVYNVLQPGMAGSLLARKLDRIRATGADVVAAGNIGCLLQIRAGLEQAGLRVRAVHPVEVLDWSLNGR